VRFGKSDKIEFISTVEGLESIEKCLPRPAKHFIPKWFKDIPNESLRSVKVCPSFPDYFSQGYIVPMWADSILECTDEGWKWEAASGSFKWETHFDDQLIDHKKPSFSGVEGQFVFKAICPWKIITPPGWSVLQLPLFYHFNQEWSVLPGVIDTDIYSEINQQVLYHGNGEKVVIKCGDPFALYIPFKRSDRLKHKVRYQTKEDYKRFNRYLLAISQSFAPNGIYRKMQRKRDR
jgi:hypothetical protein